MVEADHVFGTAKLTGAVNSRGRILPTSSPSADAGTPPFYGMQEPCSAAAPPLKNGLVRAELSGRISIPESLPVGHLARPPMSDFRHNPLLAFLVHMTQSALLRQIAHLKAENQILRSRLPKAVQTTPAERSLLVRLGSPLGLGIRNLLGIVHYKTFLRWVQEERDGVNGANVAKPRRKPGRPGPTEDTMAIILRLARETGWGYARIQGELKKLGITVAINTIKKILIRNGFHPSPLRTKGDWAAFMKRHMDTLWACDFFTKDVLTVGGKVTFYVLFFLQVGTRQVRVAGMTCNPTGPWTELSGRTFLSQVES